MRPLASWVKQKNSDDWPRVVKYPAKHLFLCTHIYAAWLGTSLPRSAHHLHPTGRWINKSIIAKVMLHTFLQLSILPRKRSRTKKSIMPECVSP